MSPDYRIGMPLPTEPQRTFAVKHDAALKRGEAPYGLDARSGLAHEWGGMIATSPTGEWVVFIDGTSVALSGIKEQA